ncbi:MAG TPA: preprotein translocase subunit SecE [bacterium]|nr:preprotein translocase subunit SecE [bacterium]
MARTEAKLAPRPMKVASQRRLPVFIERIVQYLREVWIELNRVEWASRRELISMTIVVIVVLLVMAIYLGTFDYIFTVLVKQWLLRLPPGPR